jgi:hypothetical protein
MIQRAFRSLSVLALAGSAGLLMAQAPSAGGPEVIKHKTNPHEAGGAAPAGSTGVLTPEITYHGGQVMITPKAYVIWYGNWNQSNGSDNATGQTIVRDFLYGLSGSPYFSINASYGTPSGLVDVGAEYVDNYSSGNKLTDRDVQNVVANAIKGGLPKDVNGVYFVLSSSDVAETSGFCSRYCGWHTAATISGTTIKYAFVGNANRCLNACAIQTVGPNGNAGVDAMLSVVAHELEEATTDPLPLSGWADSKGAENADKCAWTFGANQSVAANGAFYNMTLPGLSVPERNYMIQRNLDINSKCYVNYVTKTQ